MNIIKHPDKRLRFICKEVTKIDSNIEKESKQIFDSLKSIGNSFTLINGLAANQIGLERRIVVLKRLGNKYLTMINPEIVSSSFPVLSVEICASLPKTIRIKRRKLFVKIRYQNLNGKYKSIDLFGLTSFTMQQEIDHLNGKLIID